MHLQYFFAVPHAAQLMTKGEESGCIPQAAGFDSIRNAPQAIVFLNNWTVMFEAISALNKGLP